MPNYLSSISKVVRITALAVIVGMLSFNQLFAGSLNLGGDGLAIEGHDPVAYFTQNAAVKGSSDISAMHEGAKYYFSSKENLQKFQSEPAKYLPAYGGYCAFAVSRGATASVEPDKFTIIKGKLYLNYNGNVQTVWREDIPGNISKANKNWPGLSSQ